MENELLKHWRSLRNEVNRRVRRSRNRRQTVGAPSSAGAVRASTVAVTGVEGTATLIAVRPAGFDLDRHPIFDLDLVVEVGGRPPVPVTHREPMLSHLQPRALPGAQLRVKADPDRPADLFIDWFRTVHT